MSSFRFSFLILFSLFFLLSLTSAFPFGPSFSFPSFPRSPFDSIFSPHRYRPSSSSLLQCRSLCNNAERIKEYNRLKHSTYQSNYILDNNNISNNNNNKVLQIRFDIKNNGQGLESYHHQVSNRFIPHHQPSMIDLLKRNNQQSTLMKNILDVSIQRPLSPLFTPTDTDKLSRCGCDRNNNNNNNNNDIDELKASFHIPDNSNNEKITTELIKEENGEIRYYIRIPMKNNQEINHNNNIININNDSNLNINDNNNNNNNEQRMIEEQLKREKVSMAEANKERKTVENEKIPEKQKKEGGQNQYHQKKYYQKNNNNNNGNNHHHNNNNNNRNKRLVKERTSSDESLIDQLMKKEKDNFVIRDASPEQIEYKKRLIVDHHNDDEEQDIVHLD